MAISEVWHFELNAAKSRLMHKCTWRLFPTELHPLQTTVRSTDKTGREMSQTLTENVCSYNTSFLMEADWET